LLSLLSGCATFTKSASQHETKAPLWFDFNASLREMIVTQRPDGNGFGYYAEPSPYVANQTDLSLAASIKTQHPELKALLNGNFNRPLSSLPSAQRQFSSCPNRCMDSASGL
jgi:hypothetical protein